MLDDVDLTLLLGAWGSCPPGPDFCPGDIDGDGVVGTSDLLTLLATWGSASGCVLADLDLDETVGTSDLLILLVNWG